MLVTVEESNLVSDTAEDSYFVYSIEFKAQAVEDENNPRRGLTEVVDVELMKSEWHESMSEDPTMELHFRCVWHFLGLVVNGNILIKVQMMHIQDVQ
jgi:hypothetical protein